VKLLLIIYLFSIGNFVYAQTPELFKVAYSYLPEQTIKESNDSVKASFSEFETSFLTPIKAGDKLLLLVGATYRMVFPLSTINELETRLYFIAMRLSAIFNIDEKQRLIGMVIPAISSTLQGALTGDDFLTQASLGYYRDVSKRFNYGVGVIYTSRFGSPLVLPLIALNHKREKVRYAITLPVFLQATWAYNKNLNYGIKFSVNGSQYNPAQDAQFNAISIDDVNFSRVLFGPELGIRLKGPVYLTLYGGISFRRVFKFNSNSGPDQDLGLNDGAFVSAKISIKPNHKHQTNNL
jgi:hypothetical protein